MPESKDEAGEPEEAPRKRVWAYPVFQWPAVLWPPHYHWVDFDFIHLGCEYEKAGPQFEVTVVVLGVGVYIQWALPWETEESVHLQALAKEVRSKETPDATKP